MISVLRLLMVSCSILLLQACSFLALQEPDFPVAPRQLAGGLPAGYEVHSVLTVGRGGDSRDYLMVLRTGPQQVSLALMTPQGLPLYIVTGLRDQIRVGQQLHFQHALTPDALIRIVLMAYGSPDFLAEATADNEWHMEATLVERRFSAAGNTGNTIRVNYRGEWPWYREVVLADTRDDSRVMFRTMEWFHAVPE